MAEAEAVQPYADEVVAGVLRDLSWCIKNQATIRFAGHLEGSHATVSLPNGDIETATSWRAAVEMLRRR